VAEAEVDHLHGAAVVEADVVQAQIPMANVRVREIRKRRHELREKVASVLLGQLVAVDILEERPAAEELHRNDDLERRIDHFVKFANVNVIDGAENFDFGPDIIEMMGIPFTLFVDVFQSNALIRTEVNRLAHFRVAACRYHTLHMIRVQRHRESSQKVALKNQFHGNIPLDALENLGRKMNIDLSYGR
jgi:hypothetical protein